MNTTDLQHPMRLLFLLLGWGGAIVALTYSAICVLLFFRQARYIFFPYSIIETTPEYFNLSYEDVRIPVPLKPGKIEYIHGWWIKAKQSDANVLLYLHGNNINIGANVAHANRFHQLGFSVLLIDYRGYGDSKGRFPNEKRVYQDAATAWNYLINQRKISQDKIFIYGHSLGGAIAIELALRYPKAAGLIVEGSFTSIRHLVACRNLFSMFPVNLILTQRFESIKKVPNLKVPVLFIHGTDDLTVPPFMSQDLYAAAPNIKKLLLVSGAGHNNVAEVARCEYFQAVRSFVNLILISHTN